jgi:hypothetical protein
MTAIRYNLTGYQGHTLRRTLQVYLEAGQAVDLTYTCRIWPRHFPETTAGTGAVIPVPDTSELELTITETTLNALDPTKTYGYQIDAEASDNTRTPIAHGRLYVGEEYREA